MVLLEAMGAGCAIITTTAEGCAEVVGDAAIKVEPANVGQLREALEKLIGNPDFISHYDRLARDRVGQYAAPRIAAQFETLFALIIGH